MSPVTDSRGTWTEAVNPNGTIVRTLVEPSQEYLQAQVEGARSLLPAEILRIRRTVEHRGVTANNLPFATDPEARARVAEALLALQGMATNARLKFELADGRFVDLNRTQMAGVHAVIQLHLSAAAARAEALLAEIAEAEDPLVVDIESGWSDSEPDERG